MKRRLTVGGHSWTLEMPDGLTVEAELMRRFGPFVTDGEEREESEEQTDGQTVLEIVLRTGAMPETAGEVIYEPEWDGLGFVAPRVVSTPDGGTVTEFAYIDARGREESPRLWMKMPPTMERAEMVFAPNDNGTDVYFVSHAIMIAYLMATAGDGTLMMHASVVTQGGRAYLFQGRSGTGKSTHSRLWMANIEGTELLNDDHPVVRVDKEGRATVYGSPWSGKTHCYRRAQAPVGGVVRIVRGERNELRRLSPIEAYVSLAASVFYLPYFTDRQREMRHRAMERIVAGGTPCCEMRCRPDAEAAQVCHRGLTEGHV